jgi:large subunit ribosomal protein L10
VEVPGKLRRLCFRRNIKLKVVKNTLLRKAMEKTGRDYSDLYPVLSGSTSIMFSESGNEPARLINDFRKQANIPKPILKGAFIEEVCYVGDEQLDFLASLKSRTELIGDIVAQLQSPIRNLLGALQSGGNTIAGLVKTLSERS